MSRKLLKAEDANHFFQILNECVNKNKIKDVYRIINDKNKQWKPELGHFIINLRLFSESNLSLFVKLPISRQISILNQTDNEDKYLKVKDLISLIEKINLSGLPYFEDTIDTIIESLQSTILSDQSIDKLIQKMIDNKSKYTKIIADRVETETTESYVPHPCGDMSAGDIETHSNETITEVEYHGEEPSGEGGGGCFGSHSISIEYRNIREIVDKDEYLRLIQIELELLS